MKSKSGFTIVELLIVIVVIAILAAISIIAYNGIQDRTHSAAVENNLNNLAKVMELWKTNNGEVYPAITQLSTVDIRASRNSYYMSGTRNNFYYCVSANSSQYAFGVVSKPGQGYMLVNGKVSKRDASTTYQGDTCTMIGEPSSSGTAAYNGTNGNWASWAKG